jgi:hypothetical protein
MILEMTSPLQDFLKLGKNSQYFVEVTMNWEIGSDF